MRPFVVRYVTSAAVVLAPVLCWGQQLELRAARTGPDLSPQSMCKPETITTTRSGSTLDISCQPGSSAGSRTTGQSTPQVPVADIRGECKEKNGSPIDCFWKCVKDSKSDCGGFITYCTDKGGDVLGNVSKATCTGVGKQSSAAQPLNLAARASTDTAARGIDPETWCRSDTVRQSRQDGRPHITCEQRPARRRLTASDAPQVPLAKLDALCDLVNGKVRCSIWFCKTDSESNCSAFISNCAGKGGTVDGTKDDATCLLP
jgi:hypothetical protein